MNNEHYNEHYKIISIMTVALALSAGFILSVGQDVERTLDGCSRDGLCGGWDGPHRGSSRDAGEAEEAEGVEEERRKKSLFFPQQQFLQLQFPPVSTTVWFKFVKCLMQVTVRSLCASAAMLVSHRSFAKSRSCGSDSEESSLGGPVTGLLILRTHLIGS